MSLKNIETGENAPKREKEPPQDIAGMLLNALKGEKSTELENTLLKASMAGSIQKVSDEYAKLREKFDSLMTEYKQLLQTEEKNRDDWWKKIDKDVSELKNDVSKQISKEVGELSSQIDKERLSRESWEKKMNSSLASLKNVNQQLQSGIDQKIEDLSGDLKTRTIEKVEEVAEKANVKVSQAANEFVQQVENAEEAIQDGAAVIREEMKKTNSKIASHFRAAFTVGIGWKILMGAGSVAWILILLLHYVFKVV